MLKQKIQTSIKDLRTKCTPVEMSDPRVAKKSVEVKKQIEELLVFVQGAPITENVGKKVLNFSFKFVKKDKKDERIMMLEKKINFLIEENNKLQMQGPRIIEKRVEVPVEVVKYIERK